MMEVLAYARDEAVAVARPGRVLVTYHDHTAPRDKAERYNRLLADEVFCAHPHTSEQVRGDAVGVGVKHFKHHRPHYLRRPAPGHTHPVQGQQRQALLHLGAPGERLVPTWETANARVRVVVPCTIDAMWLVFMGAFITPVARGSHCWCCSDSPPAPVSAGRVLTVSRAPQPIPQNYP